MSSPQSTPSAVMARALAAKAAIESQVPAALSRPRIAIVCGTGLGDLASAMTGPTAAVDYDSIPGFPKLTVLGHAGKIVFGRLGRTETPVMVLVGRAHCYEGNSMDVVTFATRVCKLMGAEIIILTAATGSLNPEYNVGDIVVLNDHINFPGLTGLNPLRGPNADDFGPRFLALSDAYDLDLRRTAHQAWQQTRRAETGSRQLHEGVYVSVMGPSFETRAECAMLRLLNADVVGMSVVHEAIVARHCGMRVLGIVFVSNRAVTAPAPRGDDVGVRGLSAAQAAAELSHGAAEHAEVLLAGQQAAESMFRLISEIVDSVGGAA